MRCGNKRRHNWNHNEEDDNDHWTRWDATERDQDDCKSDNRSWDSDEYDRTRGRRSIGELPRMHQLERATLLRWLHRLWTNRSHWTWWQEEVNCGAEHKMRERFQKTIWTLTGGRRRFHHELETPMNDHTMRPLVAERWTIGRRRKREGSWSQESRNLKNKPNGCMIERRRRKQAHGANAFMEKKMSVMTGKGRKEVGGFGWIKTIWVQDKGENSRGLKRMIDREKKRVARLIRELKKGLKDEVDNSKTKCECELWKWWEIERWKRGQYHIQQLHSTCILMSWNWPHTLSIRYPQHSMNHREQFSLSVLTETIFKFRIVLFTVSLPRNAVKSSDTILWDSNRFFFFCMLFDI